MQSPEQAFNQSRAMFTNLTGRHSPDILFVASCMWCAFGKRAFPNLHIMMAVLVLSV